MKVCDVGQRVLVLRVGGDASESLRKRIGQSGEVVESVGLIQVAVRFADGATLDFDPLRDTLRVQK